VVSKALAVYDTTGALPSRNLSLRRLPSPSVPSSCTVSGGTSPLILNEGSWFWPRPRLIQCTAKSVHFQAEFVNFPRSFFFEFAFMGSFVDKVQAMAMAIVYLTGGLFGAIHLAAWNWTFPSTIVQKLWRISATTTVASFLFPLVLTFFIAFSDIGEKNPRIGSLAECFIIGFVCVAFLAYCISRVCILVLTLYCFVSMPTTVYDMIPWTRYIPHFG